MERTDVNEITLEYEVTGIGEPVVCIHGGLIADTFRPLVAEPSLAGKCRIITYHRRGYGGSGCSDGTVSVATQARDCVGLLRHLGVERAHVVGHSFGAAIGLQLALDTPQAVQSLVALEPTLAIGATARSYHESLERGARRYREVSAAVAVDEFMELRWPGYRPSLDGALPGAFEQAVADAGAWFEADVLGLREWSFGEAEARRITRPVLSVLGGASEALWPRFGEAHRLLLEWLPNAESFVLPGTTHFMLLQNPRALAEALVAFFARHPLDPAGVGGAASG